MENEINMSDVERYVDVVIPNIEKDLSDVSIPVKDKIELYNLYEELLRICSPYNFHCYNKYLELDEDHNSQNRAFYYHRKDHMKQLFDAFNDMEIYDLYDILIITMPPRVGKTTCGIRFLSWIIGRYPESPQLATSYSDNITQSFYIGVMEIVQSERFKQIFPESPLIDQNAKREEIWLRVKRRYPSITFVPVGGSMTGRCEAERYLYCDDLVSGLEEALSLPRLQKLCQLYDVNCRQRKKDGAKEIHVATPWSVHDVISKVITDNQKSSRCKVISIPCFNEEKESNFDFDGGFSTKYYKDLEDTMDDASFSALYKCEPIEREGLLYHKEDFQYYFDLPSDSQDTIIAVCDSKNLGKDFVCSPVGYIYGDFVFITDVTYNAGLPEVTRPLVANKWVEHKVVRGDVEMNNGGNYYAEDLNDLIKDKGGKTSIRTFYSGNNKITKIITYSDYVKKHFIFKDPSTYSPNSEYAHFMKDVFKWTQTGKNEHDDAPDGLAMMAQLVQDISGGSIKIMNRRELGI